MHLYRKTHRRHDVNNTNTGRGCLTWKFVDVLDTVLGHKPATKLLVALDTSENPAEQNEADDGVEVEHDDLFSIDNSFSSCTTTCP